MPSVRIFRALAILAMVASLGVSTVHADGIGERLGNVFQDFFKEEPAKPAKTPAPPPDEKSSDAQPTDRRVPFSRAEMQLSFAPLVKQTSTAVVNVYAEKRVQQRSPFAGDPFFEQFFGNAFGGPGRPRLEKSLGSGVIVDPSGLVMTNMHVIGGADEIKVGLADGSELVSKVVLRDERSDLAVLKIDAGRKLDYLQFGDSDAIETGDLVLAVGNPFGVGQTITSGIISALARTRVGISDFGFFIQTDAAINPGNSGGALIDMQGRLIGINSAIYSRSGGSNGIGFAIPSNMVRAVLEQARGGADAFERPYIGASFDDVTPAIAESLGMESPDGVIVTNVAKDGPAANAGMTPGDVVLAIDGKTVRHPQALGYRLATAGPGQTVTLSLLSRGERKTLEIKLIKAPETVPANETRIEGRNPLAGSTVANISPRVLQRLNVDFTGEGVIVEEIDGNSPAARAGFQPGDVLVRINEQNIATVDDVVRVTRNGSRVWKFEVNRHGQMISQVFRG